MPFVGKLYPFQEEAKRRMLERRKYLLAMDLGMGKTITAIAVAEELLDSNEAEGVLILADNSLKYQWRNQIDEWTDGKASVAVVDGTPKRRQALYREILDEQYDYAIINYDQVRNDWEIVQHLPRDVMICDEITRIKGFRAKRSKRVKKMQPKYRFGLTGQPIENRADELFSIMQWIDSDVLGRADQYDTTFVKRDWSGRILRYRNLPLLHKTVSQAMYRKSRNDPDVREQFPNVVREGLIIDMDPATSNLYHEVQRDLLRQIDQARAQFGSSFDAIAFYSGRDSAAMEAAGQIMARITTLRQICAHPGLIKLYEGEYNQALVEKQGNAVYGAPKLNAVVDLVDEILTASKENKIVLFSGWRHMLPLLQEATKKQTKSITFHAGLNAKQRMGVVDEFGRNPDVRLFLSNDCGGVGLDLPMANYLVSYDLPWSAGVWRQRNGRIDRLSSKFSGITIMEALMEGTVDEWQFDVLERKLAIGRAVIDGQGANEKGELEMSLSGLASFLRGE